MLIAAEHRLRRRAENLASVRPGTRAELSRRIGWATDYILSNYAEPIALDDIASAAHLSKFHLVRLFRQVHGTTPHDYLQRKRAQAARRLIEDGSMELNEVAAIAGFGSRWSMFRHLHRCFGASGTKLRRQRECSLAPATAPRSEVALDEAEPVSCG
jgi:transcriptional regulator GlxA family with amidase domain